MVDSVSPLLMPHKQNKFSQNGRPHRRFRRALISTVCAGVLGVLAPVAAQAQDATWSGLGLAQWGSALSWSGGSVPTGTATFGATLVPVIGFAAGYDGVIQNIHFTNTAAAYIFNVGSLLAGSSLTITGQGITNDSALAQTFNVGGALLGSGTLTFNGNGTTAGNVFINVDNDGTLNFLGSSTAGTSTINILAGGHVNFSGNATGGAASLSLGFGAVLDMSGLTSGGMTLGSLSGAGGSVNLGANTLSVGAANTNTTFGGIISGTGGLVKTGTGTWTLSGANTFSGGLSVQGGNVLSLNANALGTGNINLSGNGGLLLGIGGNLANHINIADGATGSIGALMNLQVGLTGGLTVGNGATLNLGQAGYNGTLSLFGASTTIGANATVGLNFGSLRLADAAAGNLFSVAGSTLQIAAGANLDLNGISANINNLTGAGSIASSVTGNVGLTLQGGNFPGTISNGSGILSLVKQGNASLTLGGNNSFSGGFNLQGGSLVLQNSNALGTGALTMAAGTGISLGAGMNIANNITLNGAVSLGVGSGNGTVSGVISGGFGFTKTGAGSLTLGGGNTFTGGIDLVDGILVAGNINALGTGGVHLGAGTELQLAVSGSLNNAVSIDAGDNATISVTTGQNAHLLGGGLTVGAGGTLTIGSAGNNGMLFLHGSDAFGTGATIAMNGGMLSVGDAAFGDSLASVALDNGTNGVFVLNGFNTSLGSLSGGGFVTLGTRSLTVGSLGTDTVFNGMFTGTGSVIKVGSGSLTLGGSSGLAFPGGVNVTDGTLVVAGNNALGSGNTQLAAGTTLQLNDGITLANNVVLNGHATITPGTGSSALNGIISGGFGLTVDGGGTLTLGGGNTFTGGIDLVDGILVAGNINALGTGGVHLGAGTELQLGVSGAYGNAVNIGAGANATISAITGVGGGLTGGLTIGAGGSLTIGSTGHAGTVTISGSSNIASGAQIAVDTGILAVGDAAFGGALANAALDVGGSGTLSLNGFDTSLGALLGSGSVSLGGNTLTVGGLGIDTSFGGVISGTGGLIKAGTGGLTLTGNNTFTGLTQVVDGMLTVDGTLASNVQVGANGILGGTGTISGNVDLSGILTAGGIGTAGILHTGSITMNAGASLDIDLMSPVAGGGIGNDLIDINGNLNLNGTLNIASIGTVLPGVYNVINYTGGLTGSINLGDLPLGIALGDVSIQTIINGQINIIITNGQNLQFWNGSQMTANGSIAGGSGVWNASNTNWTNASGTVAGSWGLGFAVFQGTGGTVTVEGDIIFDGLQFASNGYVIEGAAGSEFIAQDNAVFRVDSGISGAVNTAILANGGIVKVGAGELVLGAANTINGTLTIDGGTVVANHTGALGASQVVFNNVSGLTFGVNGTWNNQTQVNTNTLATLAANTGVEATVAHLNTVSGSFLQFGDATHTGTVTVLGAGNVLAANTFITVDSGILKVGDAAFGAAFTEGVLNVAETGTLDVNGFDYTTAFLSGAGTVTNNGAAGAILLVDSGNFTGSIHDGSSALGLDKIGTGTLVLSGTSDYTGATNINGGTLLLDGVLSHSHVTVNADAALAGTGTMAALTANAGSIIAPGTNTGAIGTLHVTGDTTINAGATYLVDVRLNNGGASMLDITGDATLAGGDVLVSGMLQAGMHYTILTAQGGVDGRFSNLLTTSTSAFLDAELVYTLDDVILQVVRNDTPLPGTGGGGAGGGGGGFGGSGTGPGGAKDGQPSIGDAVGSLPDNNPIVLAILNLSFAEAENALQQLSGNAFATVKSVLADDTRFSQRLITARINTAMSGDVQPAGMSTARLDTVVTAAIPSRAKSAPVVTGNGFSPYADGIPPTVYDGGTMWVQGYGSWGSTYGKGLVPGLHRDVGGFYVGVDAPVDKWLVGVAGGYSRTTFHSKDNRNNGDVDSWQLSFYGGTKIKRVDMRVGAQLGWHDIDMSRQISFTGFADYLKADYSSRTTHVFIDAGVPFHFKQGTVQPFAGLAYTYLHSGGFAEKGGAAALYSQSSNDDITTGTLGLRANTQINGVNGRAALLRGLVAWRHKFGDINPEARLGFIGFESFSTTGLPLYRDALALGAGLDFTITDNVTFGVAYDGQVSSAGQDHGVRLNLRAKY
ncbi:MAG: Outer membrane autotransporter [Candidatus Tokpelaia hoelldobleri]|uniref:Outer membrane autotransporter n=1 Tax=Candidatus Tokpelaia hoelldobleri TaxID=1902579 RepID=A0A1U9JVH1_9HYPH|nr:MAG: Outer membrane autotransporter [Candidatus Tokpelaia hoelldoblerii]